MSDMLIFTPANFPLHLPLALPCNRFIFSNESAHNDLSINNVVNVVQTNIMPASGIEAFKKTKAKLKKISADHCLKKVTLTKTENESNTNYARRIKAEHPSLTTRQCAKFVGVSTSTLRNIPQFMVMSAEAKKVALAMPRNLHENPIDYVKRVHKENPSLNYKELSCISLIDRPVLMRMKILKTLMPASIKAQEETPRIQGENNLNYAKRLRVEQPHLAVDDYCAISGADKYYLMKIMMFKTISPNAIKIGQKIKRLCDETNSQYARRLTINHPEISALDCWALSGSYNNKWGDFITIFNTHLLRQREKINEARPTSPTFDQQLSDAMIREIYRDDWSIDDLFSTGK
ncbi:hypothetical protein SC206_12600 [Rouxiella sp. T17]|uniref:hypothetical protein n=1 Tax=Rouxiella sp. T17 TaxID=3085684 RepID=UPI002FC6D929